MTELGKLIRAASRANHGRSMQAAADLAVRKGVHISKSSISNSSRCIKSITPALIRGIAAGYGVAEEDVIRAALLDMGFSISDYTVAPESAIRRDPTLSTEAKGMLLAAMEAARSSHHVEPFDPHPEWKPGGGTEGHPRVSGTQNGYEGGQLGS